MRILECSSAGDKRFSAFYAKVEVNGILDSIENHYQSVKRNLFDKKCKKGEKVEYIVFNGKKLSPKYLTPYYKLLWTKYLDKNPELVKYASTFDKFSDKFRGKCINCQADVIELYVKNGRHVLLNDKDVKEFTSLIKNK